MELEQKLRTRTPADVDTLAEPPADPSEPLPLHCPCDDPIACGGPDGADPALYCPPCRDLAAWRALQRERLAEQERLVPALRELQALAKHHPHLVADALLPALAEGIGEIIRGVLHGA